MSKPLQEKLQEKAAWLHKAYKLSTLEKDELVGLLRKAADEIARLREIEHRAWHLLDDAMSENTPEGEIVTIDATGNEDLAALHDLLPGDHPDVEALERWTGAGLPDSVCSIMVPLLEGIVAGIVKAFKPVPDMIDASFRGVPFKVSTETCSPDDLRRAVIAFIGFRYYTQHNSHLEFLGGINRHTENLRHLLGLPLPAELEPGVMPHGDPEPCDHSWSMSPWGATCTKCPASVKGAHLD